jgi:predicted enzyme related to lactoylglutathione lyase
MNLAAVRVFVRDLATAKRFYEGSLGLHLTNDSVAEGFCVFSVGSLDLIIETIDHDAPTEEQALVGRFSGLSFNVADIQAERARLGNLGVRFSGEPEQQLWGGWLATFCDPSDNELQLVQRPG